MTTQHSLPTTVSSFPPPCQITQAHIAEMLDRYDSGICDQTTCNAVALALSEALAKKVRVLRTRRGTIARTGNRSWRLPKSVDRWLDKVDRGLPVEPFRLTVAQSPISTVVLGMRHRIPGREAA